MIHNVYYNGEMISIKRYKKIMIQKRIKNVLMIVLFILLLGLIGHYDYESEVMTHKQDELNKQEVIKDMTIRCYKGELSSEFCKGY